MIALQYHHKAAEGRTRIGRAMTAARAAKRLLVPGVVALGGLRCPARARHLAARAQGLEGRADRRRWRRRLQSGAGRIAAARAMAAARRPENAEFRRVRLNVTFLKSGDALVYTSGSALRDDVKGAAISCSARRGSRTGARSSSIAALRRTATIRAGARSAQEIVGALRWPESAVACSCPTATAPGTTWFVRDHRRWRRPRAGATVAPFYIEQEAPVPPGGVPHPRRSRSSSATTICNMRSPGTASPPCWWSCSRSGRGVSGAMRSGSGRCPASLTGPARASFGSAADLRSDGRITEYFSGINTIAISL